MPMPPLTYKAGGKSPKASMSCGQVKKSTRPGKKIMKLYCTDGKKKLVHAGATGYGHNYSDAARRSFKARHKCDTAKPGTAKHLACTELWAGKGGSTKSSPQNRKGKYAVGGPYLNINPYNPEGYNDFEVMKTQSQGEMDLSKTAQKKIARRQTGRNIGSTAYGVLEGILDTTTFGLTDQLTDRGYDALSSLGREQTEARKKQSDRYRTAGQVVGATTSAILTGGATTGSAIGTTDFGTFANEGPQGLQTGLNIAGKVGGIAAGNISPDGSMGIFQDTQAGDILSQLGSQSSFGGTGTGTENLMNVYAPNVKQGLDSAQNVSGSFESFQSANPDAGFGDYLAKVMKENPELLQQLFARLGTQQQFRYGGPISYQAGGPGDPPSSRQKLPTLYVDRNDPAGQARYQAYQDSLLLHNNTIGSIKALQDAKTIAEWKSHNPDSFDPSSQAFKDHVAARARLGEPEPKARFDKDFSRSMFISPVSSRYFTQEYYEPVQPVEYGVNYMTPLAPKETSLPQRNLAIPNLPRVSRFDKQPYYTVDKKGNKILSGMDIWDERTKSWKRREVTPEEIQYYSPKTKDLGRVEFVGGGELPPANTSPNLTALAQANPDNNYFNDINLGPAGASSNAYVEDAIRFSYGPNGQTQFTVQTGQDKRGNPLYRTTDLSGLEKTVNSIEDENLRMAALGNMPGPLSYNKGYANLDLSPAARRSLGKESYFGDFGTEGNRQDIGSWEALMGSMNYLDVDPKTLKMQPISTVALRGPSKPNPVPEGRGIESCGPNGCIWQNQAGGPISYALGGETDPPKRNTDPLKYQVAGIKPTRQDSLDLYNNSIQLDKFYKAAQAKLPLEPFIEFVFNDIADDPMDPMDYLKEVDRQDRYQPVSKTLPFEHYVKTKGNLIGARDWLKGGDNEKDFPVAYIHPNIKPQFQGDASVPVDPTDPLQGNIFAYQYRYIPLAIAPFDILSEEDKKKRIEQFGLSGVPKSYLNPPKLETPSRPTLELAVPTSNPTLKPQPRTQPIMRSDNSGNESSRGNRYGQYQIGERVWDDKRKQWVDHIWSREEQEQNAKLAVDKPEPKEIIPPKFRYGGPVKYQTGGPIDSANPEQTPTEPEKIVYIGAGITRAGSMEDPKGILDRENARAYYKALGYKDENIRFLEGAGQTKELENSILKAVRENPQGNIIIDAFSGAIGSAKRAWPELTEEERKRVSEIIMAGGAYKGGWLASEDNFPGTKFTNRPDIKGHYAHYEQYLKKLQESQPKVEEPKPQLWSPPSPQVTNPANIYQGYPAEPVSTYVAPPVLPNNRVQLNPPDFRYGGGLRRWFKEDWTDVKTGEPCGRKSASDSSRPYPYCRPANKVSSKTPATTKHPEAKSRAKSKTGPTRVKPITR